MSDTMRIIVKSDKDEAKIVEQKLQQKGYQTTLSQTKQIVWDGTDLAGGHHDSLNDIDDDIFVVIGAK